MARWAARNGHPLTFDDPPPQTSIGDWARRRRAETEGEPIRLSVKINVRYEPSQPKEG